MSAHPPATPEVPEGWQEPPAPAPGDSAPAAIWMAPAALLLGLAAGIFSTLFVDILGTAFGSSSSHPTPAVNLAADYVFDLSFVGAAVYFAVLQGRMHAADFGYRRVSWRVGLAVVIGAAIGYYGLTDLYASVFALHGKEKLPSELGATSSTAALIGSAVFVCVLAPMAEEFFFRGFLFTVLRRLPVRLGRVDLGPWAAAVIVAILFGLAHTGSASSKYLIPLGVLGFILCLVRWYTGSLYPCMALHSLNNCLALGVNQLNWSAGEIVLLVIGSLTAIGVLTGPLSRRRGGDALPRRWRRS